jgi:hypothetical protein
MSNALPTSSQLLPRSPLPGSSASPTLALAPASPARVTDLRPAERVVATGRRPSSRSSGGKARVEGRTSNFGDRSVEFGRLIRQCRLRMTSDDVPNWVGPHKAVITQEDASRIVGCTTSYYNRLESGRAIGKSRIDLLERVARGLCMTTSERYLTFWLSTGYSAPGLHPVTPAVLAGMRAMLRAVPWPAWVMDPVGNIVESNLVMAHWLPSTVDATNFLEWALTTPAAQGQLRDWESAWAPAAVAYIRMTAAMAPHDPRAFRLIDDLIAPAGIPRRLWEDSAIERIQPGADIALHPLRLEVHGQVVEVNMNVLSPPGASEGRLVQLIPASA